MYVLTLSVLLNAIFIQFCRLCGEETNLFVVLFFFSAPPSYNECVFGKVNVKEEDDNEHTRGALDFAPVYTYYDWGYQPTTMNGK